ncbi:MAG TPA: transcription termination factor NusA [Sediminibacterium sp.]|jgi:N utilization substance protein A|uniref:transcription termination factor NusA n=1 Tax=Sediminibacterium sp. TaxID=1917865 RepID=UPI0008AE99D4|nr:transcription termination factor NusA [Sediminibacterium sp.]OHC86198.1 MAG: transcription termination/antitermination protein NusA [Sphingobacteriia bacterium RIFOXYC2_FULL_35_18]OHC89711.1 MAG: transcription termination/antitermination protein NusA [Sphingobacteriia bacterium RIFOXYD2_FULL_35_12]OYY07978.1 MAG: transcription termination/antitermination protein NusA [Sphingobacteriia bacterium 35-36-14]OYY99815.1 MAG: transcription termination/antitermination protein NusA [Sphingobacteriia 
MASINLIEAFQEFKDAENIDRPTMMKVVEDVFKTLLRKKFGADDNFDVIVNAEKGDLEIIRRRMIVEDGEVNDPLAEIAYSEAAKIEPDFEVGEELYEEVDILDFGRRAILAAKQTLASRISDLKKNVLVKKYGDRVGDIISAEVYQVWKKEVLLLDEEGNELILPKSEQIPQDYFKKGENIRAVVARVDMKNNTPVIILSRTSPMFLAKLLEIEVPEIFDGLIAIKKIVREPGDRAKVAVESYDDRIDPVGACVGMKGSRIHGIVRELKNENIDVINFTTNIQLLIQRSLTPAKISYMDLDNDKKQANVYLKADQVSLAIGRRGVNIKLACELTGYEIDVYREDEEITDEFDIDLDEFSDEIETWIIDEFKKIGCDTGRSILKLTVDELERRTDLERETIEEVRKVLQEEFDREE